MLNFKKWLGLIASVVIYMLTFVNSQRADTRIIITVVFILALLYFVYYNFVRKKVNYR